MANQLFAFSCKALREAHARAELARSIAMSAGFPEDDAQAIYDQNYQANISVHRQEFQRAIDLSAELNEQFHARGGLQDHAYMITIRPNDEAMRARLAGNAFDHFYGEMVKLCQRAVFTKYTVSFEQKGTSAETLGTGFHAHMVASSRMRSKGELLRAVTSTMRGLIKDGYLTPNNIDVRVCKEPEKVINKYLVQYESADGHKETTKDWDEIWREREGLEIIYQDSLPAARPVV